MRRIRKAEKKDLKEIDKLYTEGIIDEFKTQKKVKSKKQVFLAVNKNWQLSSLKKGLESELERIIVVLDKNKLVCFGHAKISKISKTGLIDKIYISRKFRKMGYGKLILKELLKWLNEKDVRVIRANLLTTNEASLKLFKKFKFKKLYSYILMEKK